MSGVALQDKRYFSHEAAPRLSASLLGGDKRRPRPYRTVRSGGEDKKNTKEIKKIKVGVLFVKFSLQSLLVFLRKRFDNLGKLCCLDEGDVDMFQYVYGVLNCPIGSITCCLIPASDMNSFAH